MVRKGEWLLTEEQITEIASQFTSEVRIGKEVCQAELQHIVGILEDHISQIAPNVPIASFDWEVWESLKREAGCV